MDENDEKVSPREEDDTKVPESPKPLAFTIDFGNGKSVDTQKHKSLLEKYQKRHRRGQSLSKLEDTPTTTAVTVKKHPLSANLPRKSNFQCEGYLSSDERPDRSKNVRASAINMKLKESFNLPLRNVTTDKMTQSCTLPSITSPEIELKDVSSPELDLVSPFSPQQETPTTATRNKILRQYSSPECESKKLIDSIDFIDGTECELDKSDTASDTGTYTLDADNYSEEQKARMSIDREFKIEQVSVLKKAEEYVQSLSSMKNAAPSKKVNIIDDVIVHKSAEDSSTTTTPAQSKDNLKSVAASKRADAVHKSAEDSSTTPLQLKDKVKSVAPSRKVNIIEEVVLVHKSAEDSSLTMASQSFMQKPQTLDLVNNAQKHSQRIFEQKHRVLSPILSPTQNMSITQNQPVKEEPKQDNDVQSKTFTKILFPSPKARTGIGSEPVLDQGSVISVTSSGAFRSKSERERRHARQLSLTKSEVHVEAYTDNSYQGEPLLHAALTLNKQNGANLTANVNVIHVAESVPKSKNADSEVDIVHANITLSKISNLPPTVGGFSGKTSPTKIPSPIHTSRPRSQNSISSLNIDLSDSSLETESYLKPTQTIINTLQQRLESEHDRQLETKYLNNDARNLLKKPSHLRHNSFDDKNLKISNKLEHFQNKNLQGIDQTYTNMLNQYTQKVSKIQNSPNNSPIKRSSSFSTKNQINTKNSNLHHQTKESNIINSPNFSHNGSIQRSASTASIKPNLLQIRRSSVSSDHQKIDRSQFGDTESSSEDDYDKNLQKKKDITNTRYNRAFSLRRARLDAEPPAQPKCPNTPEMRRKFQSGDLRSERAISVDRKPVKTNDVQSRYMQNITKKSLTPSKPDNTKTRTGSAGPKSSSNKQQMFTRVDAGRFSMRTTKPTASNMPKNTRKDGVGKKQSGGRSNSSLSSREVEFQNWKRRKSYDPMKAAAEGKRKAELAKRQNSMTQSYTEASQDCDSSPSHSSSVHRSQSFHGTAALEQLISSDEDDLTLSADEGFSPPTPSPCELSPARASLKYAWRDQVMH